MLSAVLYVVLPLIAGMATRHLLQRRVKLPHNVAGPPCLIGTSNLLELAVAVAISLFGFNPGAAPPTVVGVLIEVPVMLLVVYIVNHSKGWYERG